MVDIHSHVVYGVDDGARTLEESLAMLADAAAGGTTDIVATPHANLEYQFDPSVIKERIEELRAANPTQVRIHPGCDFHLDFDLIQDALQHPTKYSINHGPYLLIELSENGSLKSIPQILETLMRRGMIPILTHPERYFVLRGQIEEIRSWVSMGCLVQVTGQSFLGLFGSTARKMAEQLMNERMVHFIASDAHETKARTARLAEARKWVEEHHGEEEAVRLFETNPRATLTGETLPRQPSPKQKSKSWFSLWK